MCLNVIKLIQSLLCTYAVRVAAGFEVLIHGSVTGCGQSLDNSGDRGFGSHPSPWCCGQKKY